MKLKKIKTVNEFVKVTLENLKELTADGRDKAVVKFVNKVNDLYNIDWKKIDAVNEAHNKGYGEGYKACDEEKDDE